MVSISRFFNPHILAVIWCPIILCNVAHYYDHLYEHGGRIANVETPPITHVWYPFPDIVRTAFQTTASCDLYPLDYHSGNHVVLLCNSIKLRSGSSLKLSFSHQKCSPWWMLWSIDPCLYIHSRSSKTKEESLEIVPGEPKDISVCIEELGNVSDETISCKRYTIRLFIKYFNVHVDFIYRLMEAVKFLYHIVDTRNELRRSQRSLATLGGNGTNKKHTFTADEEPCILSSHSSRLCSLGVSGSATLLYPFDPYNSTIYVNVDCSVGSKSDVLISIPEQHINVNKKRKLTIFVDGTKLGYSPLTVSVGKICQNIRNDSIIYPSMHLKVLNEESGYHSFTVIRFIQGKPKNKELISIHGTLEEVEFMRMEEVDCLGTVTQSNYTYRRLRLTINDGVIKETRLYVKSSANGMINLFILNEGINVTLNGIKLRSRKYTAAVNDMNIEVRTIDGVLLAKVKISCVYTFNTGHVIHMMSWLYIGFFALGSQNLQFLDSLLSYRFAGLYFEPDTILGIPGGKVLVHRLLVFAKDRTTTLCFITLIFMEVCFVIILLVVSTLTWLPWPFIKKLKKVFHLRLPYISVIMNYCNIYVIMLHNHVNQQSNVKVYMLGYVIPLVIFEYSSIIIICISLALSLYLSIVYLRMLITARFPEFKELFKVSSNPDEMNKTHKTWIVERNKVYKLKFRGLSSTFYSDSVKRHLREIEVLSVNSVSINGYNQDCDIRFFSIRRNINDIYNMKLIGELKLHDLELISLMRRKFRVWWLQGGKSSHYRGLSASDSFFVIISLWDLLSVLFACVLNYLSVTIVSYTVYQIALKFGILFITILWVYKPQLMTRGRFSEYGSSVLSKTTDKKILLHSIITKCGRTLFLTLYIYTRSRRKTSQSNSSIYILESLFLCWSFYLLFPILQVNDLMEYFKSYIRSIKNSYHHLIAVYIYVRLAFMPRLLKSVKSLYFRYRSDAIYDINQSHHSSATCIRIKVTELDVVDAFRCVHKLNSHTAMLKYLFVHPSVDIRWKDVLPRYSLEFSNLYPLEQLKQCRRCYNTVNTSLMCNHRGFCCEEPINDDEAESSQGSNVHVIYVKKTTLSKQDSVSKRIVSDGREISTFPCGNDTQKDSIRCSMEQRMTTDEKLLGVVKWISSKEPMLSSGDKDSYRMYTSHRLQLYINVGSPPINGLKYSQTPTIITFDCESRRLTIQDPFIIASETYQFHIIDLGKEHQSYTTAVCSTCTKDLEVVFDAPEGIQEGTFFNVIDLESQELFYLENIAFGDNVNQLQSQVTVYNNEFKVGRRYVLLYQSEATESDVALIYYGKSHEVLRELTVYVGMNMKGYYNFVMWNQSGEKREIVNVNVDGDSDTRMVFGMKSKIMSSTKNMDLEYERGRAYFEDGVFHFEEADVQEHGDETSCMRSKKLTTNPCHYMLSENMSFLVPVTVVRRVRSKYNYLLYRVIPHYDILADELVERMKKLYRVLQYLRSEIIMCHGSKLPKWEGIGPESKEASYLRFSKSEHASENKDDQEPAELLAEIIGVLISKESLECFDATTPIGKFNPSFMAALQTVIVFCIKQLREATSILLRQHELANSIPLKAEMEHFDLLTSRGTAAESAASMLKHSDKYNCFMAFPFVLKEEDIHARVDILKELLKLSSSIKEHHSCNRGCKCRVFAIAALARHLTSHTDLRDTLESLCHIIVPCEQYCTATLRNVYCFVKVTRSDTGFKDHGLLWIPCFLTFKQNVLQLVPSDHHLKEGYKNRTLLYLVSSIQCNIKNDPISVLGITTVTNYSVIVTMTVADMADGGGEPFIMGEFVENGTMMLRFHKRLLVFWKNHCRRDQPIQP